jgi:hypothetical protein
MNNVNKGLVTQDLVESSSWGPRKSQRIRKSDISDDYKVYISEIQIEGDSTSFEEAIRGVHLFKWQEAKKNEMKLKMTNDVWDLEKIPNGAKTVGCNGSTR